MPNPYAHGQPADPVKDFAGREDELKRVRACVESSRAGNLTNVFIEGEWGIGKTSILNKLRPELEEHGLVISEDLSEGPQQSVWFFSNIFSALADASPNEVEPVDFHDLLSGNHQKLRKRLKAAWDELRDKREIEVVVIMLDNLERAQPEFLTSVRDIFQRLGIEGARYMLVFAGRTLPIAGNHASDPVGRFFNPRLIVHPLDEATSIEAIKKPVRFVSFSFTDEAARLIHSRTAGHPHFLKLVCHHIYDLAGGEGAIDETRLADLWPKVEDRLVDDRFGVQFMQLSDGEQTTLLHASLLGSRFAAKELRGTVKSLDTFLDRLRKGELLRLVTRGIYEIYHPLFRTYLQAQAVERKLESTTVISVPEGKPASGRGQIEDCFMSAASKKLDILDQHFRGRAVAMLESVEPGVKIRILMGEDPAWNSKTESRLKELEPELRKRIEVRAWPDKSAGKPVPWHFRCLIGDREAWSYDHSFEGAGKKKAYLRNDTAKRAELQKDFNRWWGESKPIFP